MKILNSFINEKYNTRSFKDRRKFIDRYIIEYKDEKNISYRKSFEFPKGTTFDNVKNEIPKTIE